MSRDELTTLAEAQSEATHTDAVHLVEITYWDGSSEQVERISTGSQTVDTTDYTNNRDPSSSVPADTWGAIGFPQKGSPLGITPVQETSDLRAQAVDITLDGVDQTILGALLNNDFRGRPLKIWKVWFDSGGQIDSDVMLWAGFQNSDYSIEGTRSEDPEKAGTVTVSTRAVSHLAILNRANPVMTNTESHDDMLDRAGLSTGDTSFQNVPGIANKEIFWGRDAPQVGGGGSGPSTSDPGGPGGPGKSGPPFQPSGTG